MQTNTRPIPPAIAADPPTLGEQLDAAHDLMLAKLQEMLDQKAIYREQLRHASEARKQFFVACEEFNAAQRRVEAIAKEARTVTT